MEPYAPSPSIDFYDVLAFGVGQCGESFRPLTSESVSLPLEQSPSTLDCGQLRQEPAIAALDWLFTPNLRSQEHMSVEPLRASMGFYPHFALPKISSSGFGSAASDYWALSYPAPRKLRAFGFPAELP